MVDQKGCAGGKFYVLCNSLLSRAYAGSCEESAVRMLYAISQMAQSKTCSSPSVRKLRQTRTGALSFIAPPSERTTFNGGPR